VNESNAGVKKNLNSGNYDGNPKKTIKKFFRTDLSSQRSNSI
jgi:hypothetical protein